MPLPAWLDTEDAREERELFGDAICDECGLPSWVCNAAATEMYRRGDKRARIALDREAREALALHPPQE